MLTASVTGRPDKYVRRIILLIDFIADIPFLEIGVQYFMRLYNKVRITLRDGNAINIPKLLANDRLVGIFVASSTSMMNLLVCVSRVVVLAMPEREATCALTEIVYRAKVAATRDVETIAAANEPGVQVHLYRRWHLYIQRCDTRDHAPELRCVATSINSYTKKKPSK